MFIVPTKSALVCVSLWGERESYAWHSTPRDVKPPLDNRAGCEITQGTLKPPRADVCVDKQMLPATRSVGGRGGEVGVCVRGRRILPTSRDSSK